MPRFASEQDVYQTVGQFLRNMAMDPHIGPSVAKVGCVIQFDVHNPNAVLTLDVHHAANDGAFSVHEGPIDLAPDIQLSLSGDTLHEFWLGQLNLMTAVATRRLVLSGSMSKAMALLPVLQQAFPHYRAYLSNQHHMD